MTEIYVWDASISRRSHCGTSNVMYDSIHIFEKEVSEMIKVMMNDLLIPVGITFISSDGATLDRGCVATEELSEPDSVELSKTESSAVGRSNTYAFDSWGRQSSLSKFPGKAILVIKIPLGKAILVNKIPQGKAILISKIPRQ